MLSDEEEKPFDDLHSTYKKQLSEFFSLGSQPSVAIKYFNELSVSKFFVITHFLHNNSKLKHFSCLEREPEREREFSF